MEINGGRLRKIAEFYNSESDRYDGGYSTAVCKAEDTIVKEYLTEIVKGRVLDIGSGSGLLCEMMEISDYTGIELSQNMTRLAKEKFPNKNFLVADMHQLPFETNSFDTIVSLYGPISYSLTPDKLMREISRVLKPGGWVALMPYSLRVQFGLEIGGYSTAIEPGIEKLFYTQENLKGLLNQFEEVQVLGVNYFLNTFTRFLEEMRGNNNPNDMFYDFLKTEKQFGTLLPAEYARHMIGFGRKPLEMINNKKEDSDVYKIIISTLQSENISYEVLEHEPVFTMEEAVAATESRPEQNVKVLFAKAYQSKRNYSYCLLVWTGNKPVDFELAAETLLVKKIKLASADEVKEKLGIEIGALSPIGYKEEFPILADRRLFEQSDLYINPGVHDRTIKMPSDSLKQILEMSVNLHIV